MTSARFSWNSAGITSETFDDEVVIVNFDTGKYHSLQGSGRLIWQWLQTAATVDEILERSRGCFSGDGQDIERDIRAFVATLQNEGLIIPVPADSTPHGAVHEAVASSVPFTTPLLNTFSDMQELLLLDPIHEVDEAGWPVAKGNGGE
jgi:hypothetical protein